MSNPFTYCELHTQNPNEAKAFYARLFDWKLTDQQSPVGPYTEIQPGDGIMGGLMAQQAKGAPSFWLTYIKVSDVGASTKKARELGAQVLVDSAPVPNMGVFSVLADPTGAHFGLWEPTAAKK
jgi:uncharacterized protein